jgi:hypothetical protein
MCCFYLLKKLGSRDRFDPLPVFLTSLNAALYTANVRLSTTAQKSGIFAIFIRSDRKKEYEKSSLRKTRTCFENLNLDIRKQNGIADMSTAKQSLPRFY